MEKLPDQRLQSLAPPPPTAREPPSPPPPVLIPSMSDLEGSVVEQRHQKLQTAVVLPLDAAHPAHNGHLNMDWPVMVLAFCFQSAVAIALNSLKIGEELPTTFHMMCLAMVVAVAALIVSKYISPKYPVRARALEHLGILSGVSAFLIAITISSPLYLKLTSCIIFALSLVVILVCNCPKAPV